MTYHSLGGVLIKHDATSTWSMMGTPALPIFSERNDIGGSRMANTCFSILREIDLGGQERSSLALVIRAVNTLHALMVRFTLMVRDSSYTAVFEKYFQKFAVQYGFVVGL